MRAHGLVIGKHDAYSNPAKQKVGAKLGVDEHGILPDPTKTGAHCQLALKNWRGIHKSTPPNGPV
jgi:hypothetical protein